MIKPYNPLNPFTGIRKPQEDKKAGPIQGPKQSSFFGAEKPLANPKQALSMFGVDTSEIESQVDTEIEEAKSKTFTQEQFRKQVQETMSAEGWSLQESIADELKYYKSKGYSIQGVDIDKELSQLTQQAPQTETQEQPTEEVEQEEDEGSAFMRVAGKTPGAIGKGIAAGADKTRDLVGGAIANVPGAVSEVGGFLIGKPVDWVAKNLGFENAPSLEAQFKKDGANVEGKIQETLGVDPEGWFTKAGQFGSDVGLLFTPGGAAKLLTKFPKAAKDISMLAKSAEKMAKVAPNAYKAIQASAKAVQTGAKATGSLTAKGLGKIPGFTEAGVKATAKSAATGAKEAGKFEVVSEGELSPTTLAIGAVANPAINKAGKVIKGIFPTDNISKMKKIFRPSTKQKAAVLDEDMAIILGSLKGSNKKPESIGALYDDLSSIQRDLYTNKINPLLQKGAESGKKISLNPIVDDILPKLGENKTIKGKKLAQTFGKGDEAKSFEKVVENIRKMGDIDFLEAETLKQYTSALLLSDKSSKSAVLSSVQKDFVEKLNKGLQDSIEERLKRITGEGVKAYKTEYGAIARHLDELNRRIIAESKLSGDSLFSGLGKIAGIRDIAQGNISQGMTTIMTGEVLKLMKDPDEMLKKVIKSLYQKPKTKDIVTKAAKAGIKAKGVTAASEYSDENY